ncbi:MAG TPA: cupredoxin family copper-binding protein [Candidatus Limnocylindrales bacterium]|nr:cupredoxin family copper-binding protein [Candidatus Limnocylindrales bacterium]
MATRSVHRLAVRGAIGAILALVATAGASAALAADHGVDIAGFAFSPDSITIAVGDTVTWTNGDGVSHTATANDSSFDTGTIAAGSSRSATFSTAGTFSYHCRIHPAMTATIVVAGSTTPPPTDTLDPAAASSNGGAPWALLALAALGGLVLGRRRFARPVEAPAAD